MNHYRALRRASDGRWEYTCTRDGRTWAADGCARHTNGHATEDEAYACQKRFLLDYGFEVFDPPANPRALYACAASGCSKLTAGRVAVDPMQTWFLCDVHRTREVTETLFEVGESWSSY